MPKQVKKHQYTVKNYLKALVACIFVGGIILLPLMIASDPKNTVTDTKVQEVLIAHGYTPTERTELYTEKRPDMGITKNISYIEDPIWFEFFVFEDSQLAINAYQSLSSDISAIERDYYNNSTETHGYRANFMYRSLEAGGKFYYLMRIDNTLLYTYGNEELSSEIYDIAKELGYSA